MTEGNDKRNRATKRMRWVARIWSFPIILYTLLVATGYVWNWMATGVADPYAVEDYPPIENLPPIFLSLSVLGLGIAWRWERLGAVIALVFEVALISTLLVQTPLVRDFPRSAFPYLMSMVTAIPGMLFLMCSRRSRKAIRDDST